MFFNKNQGIIKDIIEEFFDKATLEVQVEKVQKEKDVFKVDLETDLPQLLIGEQGQTLNELQYILKLIIRRRIIEPFFLDIDINHYKEKKQAYLQEMARSVADEVALSKQEKELSPMTAQDRRFIH
ncbi:MAG: KH domain-containing protein, partial [bacterium]|nr:KH domain-containing protein [bacterium]